MVIDLFLGCVREFNIVDNISINFQITLIYCAFPCQ